MSVSTLAWLCVAQALSVSVELSDRQAEVGDIVTMQITAVAQINGDLQVELPQLPAGIDELSRSRSESTSISFVNGRQSMNRQVVTSVELEVTKAGRHEIPPIVARIGKNSARSRPTVIEVGESQIASVNAGDAISPPTREEGEVFVRYRLNKADAYVGEQVLLDLEIITRPGAGFSVEQSAVPPELDAFWREIVDQPKQPPRRVVSIKGRTYHAYRLWRLALFPLSAGPQEIPSVRLTLTQGRSIFGGGRRLRRRSPPLRFEVKPLPPQGRPKAFVPTNVGDYGFAAAVDHARVPAGKAILLTLALSGRGNVQAAKIPELKRIDGFRVFPPTSKESIERTASGVRGTKNVEVLLMPTRGGRLEIPPVEIAVFDPYQNQYRTLRTKSLRVFVDGEPKPSAVPEKEAEAVKLSPLRVNAKSEPVGTPLWAQAFFWPLLAAPWILLGLLFGVRALKRRVPEESGAKRRKSVRKETRKRLEAAIALLQAGQLAEAYAAFADAVLDLGTERLEVGLRGLTLEELDQTLTDAGAPASLVGPLVDELRTADYARFAPGALDGRSAQQIEQRWTRIVGSLDRLGDES